MKNKVLKSPKGADQEPFSLVILIHRLWTAGEQFRNSSPFMINTNRKTVGEANSDVGSIVLSQGN